MKLLTLLLLLSLPTFAKDKQQLTYQDAVLKAFRVETSGSNCSNDIHDDVDGGARGTFSCSDTERSLYTIQVADITLVLTPEQSAGTKAGAALSAGWSTRFARDSVLANRLSGTPILLRADGKHYFVKIGKRESMYSVVESR